MNALPTVNPYEAPTSAAETRASETSQDSTASFALRAVAYALCGLGLFAAFCTKWSVACEYFYYVTPEKRWIGFACLLASTLVTGLLVDRLVRSNWNFVLVALAWVAVNSVATPLLAFVVGMAMSPGRGIYSSVENIALGFVMCLFYGLIIGVMCLHLSLPICSACVWLARRLGTEQEPAKG